MPQADVARKYGVSAVSVHRWNMALQGGGEKALKMTKAPGKPLSLSAPQVRYLHRIIKKGAEAYGFSTDLWTSRRVQSVIKDEFGVRLHKSNVLRLLARMGLSWQRPERRARERDEKEIKRWVKEEWPKIAKKGRSRGT